MAEVDLVGIGMKAEGRTHGVKRKLGDEERVIRKRGRGRGFGRPPNPPRVMAAESTVAIQQVFEVCRAVFKGPGTVPAPGGVQILELLLGAFDLPISCMLHEIKQGSRSKEKDKTKPEDVGLSAGLADLLFFKDRSVVKGNPRITLANIHKCDSFSMCLIFLPPTAVIPLHNHPEMTVFSKLLIGSMHIKSYDWIENLEFNECSPSAQARPARLLVDSDFTAPCKTSILYPTTGGNIHTFRAITMCVVLDILGPPYSKQDDRDCAYYKEHSYSHVAADNPGGNVRSADSLCWLEEIDMPNDLKMHGIEYLGPQIVNVDG